MRNDVARLDTPSTAALRPAIVLQAASITSRVERKRIRAICRDVKTPDTAGEDAQISAEYAGSFAMITPCPAKWIKSYDGAISRNFSAVAASPTKSVDDR
jgi:hypothetical protein